MVLTKKLVIMAFIPFENVNARTMKEILSIFQNYMKIKLSSSYTFHVCSHFR